VIDICSFLDSVLDENFLQLETNVTFPGSEPSPDLLSTIALCSPQLRELKLDFYSYGDTYMKLDIGSLTSLEHLTHLSLSSILNHELRLTALSLVGKWCPLLTHLSIFGGYPVGNQEILSLVLGETMISLFPNDDYVRASRYDRKLDYLKVPQERLTPICSTLRELIYDDCDEELLESCHYTTISSSTVAFALRHLPFLTYLGSPVLTCCGIKKLFKINKAEIMSGRRSRSASVQVPLEGQIAIIPGTIDLFSYKDCLILILIHSIFCCRLPFTDQVG